MNGPEILDKYVGAAEKNIRDLFLDAEKDQKEHGEGMAPCRGIWGQGSCLQHLSVQVF